MCQMRSGKAIENLKADDSIMILRAGWWKRYVDDTYTVLKKAYAQDFSDHLNTVDDDIKWTTEGEGTYNTC